MSNIKKIYYSKIPESEITPGAMSDYYYLANMSGVHADIREEFVDHETRSVQLRNRLLGEAIRNANCPKSIDLNSSTLGISSIQNAVILMADIIE
ncbi:MAG: hypothetical protein NC131_11345 [Roseburia sp.]|nr:hypothetical protein [Roseburia sp.]